ncbi:MAG TPA: Uma2 family endonuclease [Gemmataceae bacterium]|nr:Uma2 family endonuclease [Gemmataceae bacterium]
MSTPSVPTTSSLTADQFFDWCHRPENEARHWELERGNVVEVSRPGVRHCAVCANVSWLLVSFVRHRGRGYVLGNDAGVIWERNPDTVRGPDVVLYDKPTRFEDVPVKYTDDVPVLAVEVLSPTDRTNKVNRRIAQFLRWGAKVVWLLDPEDRTLAVHRPQQLTIVLDESEELHGEPELPGFRCRVADFYSLPGE